MLDLAALARRLRAKGHVLRLVGPQPHIMALIELTGLHRLPGVEIESSAAALT